MAVASIISPCVVMIWMTENVHREDLHPLRAFDILLPLMSSVLHSRAFGQRLHSELSFTQIWANTLETTFCFVFCFFLSLFKKEDIFSCMLTHVQVISFPGAMSLSPVNFCMLT